ncbi:hypothetical protein ACLB1O_22455 [Escherichia coli]
MVVDAGISIASHAAQALEIGADRVLINTAIAVAGRSMTLAKAFRLAVEAGPTGTSVRTGLPQLFCSCHQPADRISGGIGMKIFATCDNWTGTTSACVSTAKRLLT